MANLNGRTARIAILGVGPEEEREDRRVQVKTSLSQPVLEPIRFAAITHSFEQAVLDELGEPVGEDVSRHAKVALELAVAVNTRERFPKNLEAPPIGEQGQGLLSSVGPRSRGITLVL